MKLSAREIKLMKSSDRRILYTNPYQLTRDAVTEITEQTPRTEQLCHNNAIVAHQSNSVPIQSLSKVRV